jgi:hypothetical protein
MQRAHAIDSLYMGDPTRHVGAAELERRLRALDPSPRDAGRVVFLLRRGEQGRREEVASALLSTVEGMPGDRWYRDAFRKSEAQLTAMEARVVQIIANGQSLSVFGDQLVLDLDLSDANLPVGSRVRLGEAVLEVTPKPHKGCAKYRARFGPDALQFISRADQRPRNLRGVYIRVVSDGLVRVGDGAEVLSRG